MEIKNQKFIPMKKLFSRQLFYIITPLLSFAALPAYAVCPVCIVAVGAGLGLSEYLGIDNTIAGLWIGGLLVSMIVWTINWFNKKKWFTSPMGGLFRSSGQFNNQDLRDIIIVILYYGLTFWPLWSKNLIGHPASRLWGIDKVVLGTVVGSLVFLLMTLWYNNIKKRRGHAHFPYEKVAMPVAGLLIFSFLFYFLTK